jgi:hypothetical protein
MRADFLDDPTTTADDIAKITEALFQSLIQATPVSVRDAVPPSKNGVYAFSIDGEIVYVGEAAGTLGLWDRIKRKHVSGDEGHVLQSEFEQKFPDRLERREFIKTSVFVQWIEVPDSLMVSVVEKFAIAVLKPRLNKSVVKRTIR